MADNFTTDKVKAGVILAGVAVAAIFVLPPLFKLFGLVNDVAAAPGEALDLVRKAAKDTSSDVYSNSPTTIPGLSTDGLKQIIDKQIISAYDGVPIRTQPHSNAPVAKYINSGDANGYVYSAVNEKLGNKNIIWLSIEDLPNGSPNNYIRLDDTTLKDLGINFGVSGCSCNQNVSGIIRNVLN